MSKRILSLLLVVVMALSMTLVASAEDSTVPEITLPLVGNAHSPSTGPEHPELDAVKDDIYAQGVKVTGHHLWPIGDAAAERAEQISMDVTMLTDGTYLFIFAEIVDDFLYINTANNEWNKDAFTVAWSLDAATDLRVTFWPDPDLPMHTNGLLYEIYSAFETTDNGWNIEIAIPMENLISDDGTLRMDFEYVDLANADDNMRDTVLAWSEQGSWTLKYPTKGIVNISETPVEGFDETVVTTETEEETTEPEEETTEPEEETTEPEEEETKKPADTTKKTDDKKYEGNNNLVWIVVAAAVAVVVVVVVIVVVAKKKKK